MNLGSFVNMSARLTRSRMRKVSASMASPLVIGPANPMNYSPSTEADAAPPKLDFVVKSEPTSPTDLCIASSSSEMSHLEINAKAERKRGACSHLKIEYGLETEKTYDTSTDEVRSPKAKKDKWQPPVWKQHLLNIYEMRRCRDAPVDTMGCEKISDQKAEPKVTSISVQFKCSMIYFFCKVCDIVFCASGRKLHI